LDRVSVPEAAERLGVTQDAVRKRIHRDAIEWEQDADGRYYVYLEDTEDTTRNTYRATRQDSSRDSLIRAMQDQIDTLKQEVVDWKEEARRKDHLLAAALERIPAIEAPRERRESPETATQGEEGVEVPLAERRSWWQRVFGG
jgi:predicted ArsR family transcriptional regulator